jgi:hypothetical protein
MRRQNRVRSYKSVVLDQQQAAGKVILRNVYKQEGGSRFC